MPMFLDEYLCGYSFALVQEVQQLVACAVVGFVFMRLLSAVRVVQKTTPDAPVFTATTRSTSPLHTRESPVAKWTRLRRDGRDAGAKALELKLHQPAFVASKSSATALPVDITSSIAAFGDLADVAQLAAASQSSRHSYWHSHQVWAGLSVVRGIECQLPLPTEGVSAERFRQTFFRVDADRAEALLQQARNGRTPAAEILEEATHMLRGLMPRDGQSTLSCVVEGASDAIWATEASNDGAAPVVESLLQVARRRDDIISPFQLGQLEDSYSASLSLSASMKLSMQHAYDELPAVQAEALGYWPDLSLSLDAEYSDWIDEVYRDLIYDVSA